MATLIKHELLPGGELYIPGSLEEMWIEYHKTVIPHIGCPGCAYSYRHAYMSAAIAVIDVLDDIGLAGNLVKEDPRALLELTRLLAGRLKADAEITAAELKAVSDGLISAPKHLEDE